MLCEEIIRFTEHSQDPVVPQMSGEAEEGLCKDIAFRVRSHAGEISDHHRGVVLDEVEGKVMRGGSKNHKFGSSQFVCFRG